MILASLESLNLITGTGPFTLGTVFILMSLVRRQFTEPYPSRFIGTTVADPRYHELLGIDPEIETPPDYFQLLGVDYAETDEDVIAKNFKTKMTKIQHIKGAKHKGFIELLKDDLRKAKLTLTKAERRKKYLAELEEKKNADQIEDFKKEVKPLFMLGEISKTIFDKLIEKGQALNLSAEQAERIIDQLAEAEGVSVKKVEEPKPEPEAPPSPEPEPEKAFPQDQSDPQMVQPLPSTASPPPNLPSHRPNPNTISGRHPVHRPPPSPRRTSSERLIRPPIAPMAPMQRPSASGRRPIAPPQDADLPSYQRPGTPARPNARPDNRVPVGQFPNPQPIGGIKTGKDRFSDFYGTSSGTGPPPQQNYPNPYGNPNPPSKPNEYDPMNRPNITTGRDRFANFYGQQNPGSGYPAQNEPLANPQSNFPAMYGSGTNAPSAPTNNPPKQQYGNMYGQESQAASASGRMPAQYNAMPSAPSGPTLADRINKDPSYRRKLKEVLDTFNRGAKSVKMGYKAHQELAWYFPPKNKKRDSITYQINGVGYDKIFDIEMKMFREGQRFMEASRKLAKEHNVREGLPPVFFDRLEKAVRSLRSYQESGREIKVRLMGSVAKAEQIRIWSDFLRELRSPEFAEPLEIRE